MASPTVKPDDFYTREELIGFFPKKKLGFKKRYTFTANPAGCIYENTLVDLSSININPEKLLASILLYTINKDALCNENNVIFIVNTYDIGYEYHEVAGSHPLAALITLLRRSQRRMSCLCHLLLTKMLGGKSFSCLNHEESGKILGKHKVFNNYAMDIKTNHLDLVNWVIDNSKPIIPFIAADNAKISQFVEEAMAITRRLDRIKKFFMEFCKFDDAEVDYLFTVINHDIDIVNIPTLDPEIFPPYLQEKYKLSLLGTTNDKGECSTCYLKEHTRINCAIHTEVRVQEDTNLVQTPTIQPDNTPKEEKNPEPNPKEEKNPNPNPKEEKNPEPKEEKNPEPKEEKNPELKEENSQTECTICYDKKPTHVAVPCGHAYCGTCIGKIFKSNKVCSFCKRTMTFPLEILWN
jgi:hypothetical protein